MNYKNIKVKIDNDLAYIEINRPDKYNALNVEIFEELQDFLLKILGNPNYVRGALLFGAGGKAFAAGADIKEMAKMNKHEGKSFAALAQKVTLLLEEIPIPVIAAVDGFALGGGCELAMACDFIYATKKSIFGQPEVTLGLIPGFGGCVRFVRLLGVALAKEYIYTAKNINAENALSLGLINKIVENRDELFVQCLETMNQIFENSRSGVKYSKNAINSALGKSPEDALKVELNAFVNSFEHQDKKVGVSAFIEKRAACFP